jgi:hypothetical protein
MTRTSRVDGWALLADPGGQLAARRAELDGSCTIRARVVSVTDSRTVFMPVLVLAPSIVVY